MTFSKTGNPNIKLKHYLLGSGIGFFLGFLFLHPFSMLFQKMVYPSFSLRFSTLKTAFHPHHLPMAFFFGILGLIVGDMVLFFLSALSKEQQRVKILEGLLPICSYCKKIRDDSGKEPGSGEWVQIERYVSQRSRADFSHGICPACYKHVEKQIEERYGSKGE